MEEPVVWDRWEHLGLAKSREGTPEQSRTVSPTLGHHGGSERAGPSPIVIESAESIGVEDVVISKTAVKLPETIGDLLEKGEPNLVELLPRFEGLDLATLLDMADDVKSLLQRLVDMGLTTEQCEAVIERVRYVNHCYQLEVQAALGPSAEDLGLMGSRQNSPAPNEGEKVDLNLYSS